MNHSALDGRPLYDNDSASLTVTATRLMRQREVPRAERSVAWHERELTTPAMTSAKTCRARPKPVTR